VGAVEGDEAREVVGEARALDPQLAEILRRYAPAVLSAEAARVVRNLVACRTPSGESCSVTELNFSMSGASGTTYYPVFTMFLTGLRGLFEGGQIPGGETWSGGLVFVLDGDETDLVLAYGQAPGMVGGQATFSLGD